MRILAAAVVALAASLAFADGGTAPITIVIATELGDIRAVVAADRAPRTAANFLRYVREGHYEGARFHRTVRLDNQPGKDVLIECKGPVAGTVQQILGGVRSACTYVGARRLKELTKRTTFVRVRSQANDVFERE